jgi:hypothetical protein
LVVVGSTAEGTAGSKPGVPVTSGKGISEAVSADFWGLQDVARTAMQIKARTSWHFRLSIETSFLINTAEDGCPGAFLVIMASILSNLI